MDVTGDRTSFAQGWRVARRGAVVACLLVAASPASVLAAGKSAEQAVTVATPDGMADGFLYTPSGKGPWPAVILWHDLSGQRSAYRDMGKKLAGEGFVVFEPNAFYRSGKATGESVDLANADMRKRQGEYRAAATDDGVARDAQAYVVWLNGLRSVNHQKKIGTVGFDVGGSYAFRTAAAVPDKVGAVASIHGLGVATPRPNSPHLLVPQTKATYYVVQSKDDDAREPEDKTDYEKVIAEGGLKGTVEVAEGNHGFAVPDNANYDAASAEKAWSGIVALMKSSL